MMDTMLKLADKYTQTYPGTKVNVIQEPEGGTFDALIAAGNQPDIFVGSFGSQIGKYAARENIIPLEDLAGAKDLLGQLEPETVKQVYGHNYYIPLGSDVTMMIYNKDLFKEAGLDPAKPPQTWDEFLSAAEKIQALPTRNGNKVYGTVFWNDALAYGGWYWNLLQPIYLNANQNQCLLLNKLGTDISFDKPECKMVDFLNFTKKAQQFAPPTMEKNFFSRTVGMWMQYGYSWEPNLKEATGTPMKIGDDVGIAPVPVQKAGDTSYSTYGGRSLSIMKTTPDRQARAWDFIKFLMTRENNLQFIKELGYLPTLTSLKSDAYFADPARKPFIDQLKNSVFPQMFSSADDVANAVLGVYQQVVVQGATSPEQGLTQASEKGRAALKK
jgi:multiple sugar transport system substrate-binding protein